MSEHPVDKWRIKKGLTQVQAAHRFKIAQSHYSQIVNSKSNLSEETARRIARHTKISVKTLLRIGAQARPVYPVVKKKRRADVKR